jgi:bifunctional UDP-N-acetylglucosamine pyrophosphorylase / glucosamine-1-phosphate N-acetyltransferase
MGRVNKPTKHCRNHNISRHSPTKNTRYNIIMETPSSSSTQQSNLVFTILAGGLGKRMNSTIPKVLHLVKGKPMIVRLLQQVGVLDPRMILIVVGKYRDVISTEISKWITDKRIVYVDQPEPLGTGHAVSCTLGLIKPSDINIILNGDVPMLSSQTIGRIYRDHLVNEERALTITAIELDDPTGNGRIVRDSKGYFQRIVEHKDANSLELWIKLVNVGIYVVSGTVLLEIVPLISNNNAQSEYYLTDLVSLCREKYESKNIVGLHCLSKASKIEIYNVNTAQQLEDLERIIDE